MGETVGHAESGGVQGIDLVSGPPGEAGAQRIAGRISRKILKGLGQRGFPFLRSSEELQNSSRRPKMLFALAEKIFSPMKAVPLQQAHDLFTPAAHDLSRGDGAGIPEGVSVGGDQFPKEGAMLDAVP